MNEFHMSVFSHNPSAQVVHFNIWGINFHIEPSPLILNLFVQMSEIQLLNTMANNSFFNDHV